MFPIGSEVQVWDIYLKFENQLVLLNLLVDPSL